MESVAKISTLKKDKHPLKISSKGRTLKRTQKVITSSDEAPPKKKSKKTSNVDEQMKILKEAFAKVKKKEDANKSNLSNYLPGSSTEISKKSLKSPAKTADKTILHHSDVHSISQQVSSSKLGGPSITSNEVIFPPINIVEKYSAKAQIENSNQILLNNSHESPQSNSIIVDFIRCSPLEFNSALNQELLENSVKKPVHITLEQKSNEVSLGGQTSTTEILGPISVTQTQMHSEKEDIILKTTFEAKVHADTNSQTLKEISKNDEATKTQIQVPVDSVHAGEALSKKQASIGFGESAIYVAQSNPSLNVDLMKLQEENYIEAFYRMHTELMERMDFLTAQNQTIIQQLVLIFQKLDKTSNEETEKLSETFSSPLKGFPLKELEEFNKFESEDGKETRAKLYKHLLNNGGFSLRSFLSCAMRQTISDKLVCSFTWNGQDDTIKFSETKVANVFYQSSKRCINFQGPLNKEEFKTHMLEVLRHTKQRFRKNF
ncbi:uncharacterized protein LOC122506302 isoform X3 [Leptopilina heterotoma]|nr:uncharacterized protein LOC122506302 isoform X3 [Leptopilina heterotoma]XP_043474348.1 uncharacterized protein LOC122506302 isoform X3 [Leptopilina heterotoma]XP_043474349.1 uncharacterized protein LOC122506302 isoform X3 [Leptopilina heterotoma]XP_043474350.1 uncharacterized protein LOC122506302 isoform X3 [Leptopilina heterotoma]XP_043474351.1 uncharacterized protein LOC122506302 isoform X3 [Leptopilina heterotoma]